MLKRFEPSALPIEMALCPFMAAFILTRSSGMLVPIETIVRPITSALMPKRFANDEAPNTSPSAP